MLNIWGRISSINVRKVVWCAQELGLDFQRTEAGGRFGVVQTPEYLRLNPNAMVPVLIEGEVVLWESNTICRYLAASRGRGDLLPAAPARRGLVEQWMDWQATDLNAAWRYAFQALVRKNTAFVNPTAIEASVAAWNDRMAIPDDRLAETGAFLAGQSFTPAQAGPGPVAGTACAVLIPSRRAARVNPAELLKLP